MNITIFYLVQQENKTPEDDIQEDNMEAEGRRKRQSMTAPNDVDEIKTYDPNMKTNHYESKGSYTLELVGQQRLLRTKRAADYVDFSEAAESTLLAFINHSKLQPHSQTLSLIKKSHIKLLSRQGESLRSSFIQTVPIHHSMNVVVLCLQLVRLWNV